MPQATRLRIYCDDNDRRGAQSLVHAVVHLLWDEHASGVTVLRGSEGFGAHRHLHTNRLEVLSTNLPVVIEWVEAPERHAAIWPKLEPLVQAFLVTREQVEVMAWPSHGLAHLEPSATVDSVMTTGVVSVSVDTPIVDVVRLMLGNGLRFVPVLEGDQLCGVITNSDLVERAGLGARLEVQPVLDASWRGELGAVTAGDVMSRDPISVPPGTKLSEAARLMLERRIKRLPVLRSGRLVGIVSRYDLLKTVASGFSAADQATAPTTVVASRIGDVSVPNAPAVTADADLGQLIDAVVSTRLNQAVVVDDEGHVLGVVPDTELLRQVGSERRHLIDRLMRRGHGKTSGGHHAGDLMTPAKLVVDESTPIVEAINQMIDQHVKVLFVVDDQGCLAGMVDRADALRALFGGIRPS